MPGSTRRTDLLQADVLVAICVEDLEEAQRGVARVLDVVAERSRHVADVTRLGARGQTSVPEGSEVSWAAELAS